MEPVPYLDRTEVIKLFIEHRPQQPPAVIAIDEKGDEYQLAFTEVGAGYRGTIEAVKITPH